MPSRKTKIKPRKRSRKKGLERERILYDLAYFVVVLTLAALILSYVMEVRPEMVFERQSVAYHTSAVLNILGVDSLTYENIVRISVENPEKEEISNVLSWYGFEERQYFGGIEFRAQKLHPDSEEIVDAYLSGLKEQGLPIYVSKATVFVETGEYTIEADIVPECVGWIGIFAISALIIAYPRVPRKKRFIGLVIAWPLMYMMNIARVSTTIYAGFSAGPGVLDFTHDFLWRTVLIVWALILWVFWIYFIVDEKKFGRKKK